MMYAYCFIPRPDIPSQRHIADDILRAFPDEDCSVATNVFPNQPVPASLAATVAATHRPPLDHMDLLVLEGGREDSELGFLVAHAIATKKPVLYLYPKGTRPALFDHVSIHSLPANIVPAAYQADQVGEVVRRFLEQISGKIFREVPHIKFTLRITDRIDQYLQRQAKDAQTTKADFLREQIELLMKRDTE